MRENPMPALTRAAAMTLIGGGLLSAARPATAQTSSAIVRIGAISIDAFGEAYYGTDTGIFLENGINPQVSSLSNGATIIASVLGGDLDVGMGNTVQVAAAVAHDLPLQMLAPASLYSVKDAASSLMVAKDSPFKSAKDLAGQTIAVSTLKDFSQLGAEAWLERNKVPPDSVRFVELKFGEMGAALARGTVQAAIIAEPAKSDAIRAGQIRPFGDIYLAIAPEFATIVWFATKPWIQKNPDVARKLVNGIFATARWANSHTRESGDILAKASKMDPALVAGMLRLYFATTNDKKFVTAPLDLAARYGMLARPVTVTEFLATP
jgi:NitT/TauT family transport system substrate-binding protein